MFAQSMIPKSMPSDSVRGWIPVSRLREASATARCSNSAGEGRSDKIMPKLKRNVGSNLNHFALAAEFEQGVLVRLRRDFDMHRAGLAQRRGD